MNKIITALLVFLSIICFSQNERFADGTEILFDVDVDQLNNKQIKELEKFTNTLTHPSKAYVFSIQGYADSTGSIAYNQKLSERRANSVKDYLKDKGFKTRYISSTGKGEERARAVFGKSRRVEITAELEIEVQENIGTYTLKKQRINIETSQSYEFSYSSGTKVSIPEEAFIDKNGNSISGTVNIEYVEYRNPLDFILSDIPMSLNHGEDGEHFNSAGMFEIRAFKEDQEVYLKNGKNIQVDFVTIDTVKNWDFYEFDENNRQWTQNTSATLSGVNTNNQTTANRKNDINFFYNQSISCGTDSCSDLAQLISLGKRYTNQPYNLAKKLILLEDYDSVWTEYDKALKKKSIIDAKKDSLENTYHINFKKEANITKRFLKKSKKVFFTLSGNSFKKYEEIKPLENIIWVADSITGFNDLTKQDLKELKIEKGKRKQYMISFKKKSGKNNKELITLKAYAVASKKIMTKLSNESNEIIALRELEVDDLRKKSHSIRNRALRPMSRQMSAYQDLTNLPRGIRPTSKIREMNCFWELNKPFMSGIEKELNIYSWYKGLFKNRQKMKKKYVKIEKKHPMWKACLNSIQYRQELERKRRELAVSVNRQVIQSLSLSQTGIFNCDQIHRLKSPVEILAKYEDKEGKSIDILICYLLDNTINGAIRYDGYRGLSPNKFVYSSSSINKLIAIDTNGKMFVVKNDQFKRIKNKKATQIFTLEEILDTDNPKEFL